MVKVGESISFRSDDPNVTDPFIRKFTFNPATLGGVPVVARYTVTTSVPFRADCVQQGARRLSKSFYVAGRLDATVNGQRNPRCVGVEQGMPIIARYTLESNPPAQETLPTLATNFRVKSSENTTLIQRIGGHFFEKQAVEEYQLTRQGFLGDKISATNRAGEKQTTNVFILESPFFCEP